MIKKLDWIKLPSWVTFEKDYFVLSDIHGRFNKFKELMLIKPEGTKTIILGDYTDRGCQNLKVIKSLIDKNFILLKGNHDIALYYTLYPEKASDFEEIVFSNEITYNNGGDITIKELKSSPRELYSNFYSKLKTYYIDDSLLFVHSGVYPDNVKESLEVEDGISMCLYNEVYKFHPVWAGQVFGYPKIEINNKRMLVIHGHTPTKIEDCFKKTHVCCDIGMKSMMGLLFKHGKTANGIRPYICF